jgi:hypothetical protein
MKNLIKIVTIIFSLSVLVSSQCVPHPSSTYVADTCSQQGLLNVTSYLSVNGTSQGSIASLLNVASVIGAIPFYDGGIAITTQNVTIVDALTADVRLSTDGPIATADIGQLLAGALYARATDGIYPNIQDSLLTRLEELDNIVGSLEDIDFNTATIATNSALIVTSLNTLVSALSIQLPKTITLHADGTSTPSDFATVSLVQILADTLYSRDISSFVYSGGNRAGRVVYQPAWTATHTPYMNADVWSGPGSNSFCTLPTSDTNAPPPPYGVAPLGAAWESSATADIQTVSSLSSLPFYTEMSCNPASSFGDHNRDYNLMFVTGANLPALDVHQIS